MNAVRCLLERRLHLGRSSHDEDVDENGFESVLAFIEGAFAADGEHRENGLDDLLGQVQLLERGDELVDQPEL